jgi:hypothetical protein
MPTHFAAVLAERENGLNAMDERKSYIKTPEVNSKIKHIMTSGEGIFVRFMRSHY